MLKNLVYLLFLISWTSECANSNLLLRKGEERNVTCRFVDTKYTCDCAYADEITSISQFDGSVFHIEILNCRKLVIPSNFLYSTNGLRHVTFTNIRNLFLQENSLSFRETNSNNGLVLEFTNVNAEEVHSHAITGDIEQIIFVSSTIGRIYPFAFSSSRNSAYLIKFNDVKINRIDPQAFKKIIVDKIEITNTEFQNNIPSKSFYEITVTNYFKIQNSTFKALYSKAILIKEVSKLVFTENQLERLYGEAIEMSVRESILIRNNILGIVHPASFKAISISNGYLTTRSEKMDFNFINNTIEQEGTPSQLLINTSFHFIPKSLYYLNDFNCELSDTLRGNNFFKIYGDTIYFKLNKEEQFKTFASIVNTECVQESYLLYIIIGVVILILIILIAISVVVYYYIQKKRKQKLDIVIPEPRTYRETQIVLQIENAGLLKTDL